MKLTKKKAIEMTREMFDWLYNNPLKNKSNFIAIKAEQEWKNLLNYCPCCEYVKKYLAIEDIGGKTETDCSHWCPLIWPENDYGIRVCFDHGGLWYEWRLNNLYYKDTEEWIRQTYKRPSREEK